MKVDRPTRRRIKHALSKGLELYRCWKCKHEWTGAVGPQNSGCPKCGHLYMDWLTYNEERFGR